MPKLVIDGRAVEVQDGATVLDAARKLGIDIPTLCSPETGANPNPDPVCLACAVKDEAAGRIVPACAVRVREGMDVRATGGEVERARRAALALLAAEHAGDCEAPCRRGCPLAVDIDAFVGFVRDGDLEAAADAILEHNPFPALTGRLCAAPCEKTCRRKKVDESVSIRLLEQFVGDSAGGRLPAREPASGRCAVVVGAGPAGLSAAFHLLRSGLAVTVYEKTGRAGGGLLNCEADGRLPAAVLRGEIGRVAALGAEFVFNAEAGGPVFWDELERKHDVLVIACGEVKPAELEGLGLTMSESGVTVDHETFATSRPGVFAIGSAVKRIGQSVHALRQGWEAANAIRAYLATGAAAPEIKRFDSHLPALTAEELAAFAAHASRSPRHPKTGGPLEPAKAAEESRRCLSCACRKRETCVLREAAGALRVERHAHLETRPPFRIDRSHPDVVLEPGKCVKCGRCVRLSRERGEPVGLAFLGRGIEMTVAAPFGLGLKDALTFTAAECAESCPTGALAFKRRRRMNHG